MYVRDETIADDTVFEPGRASTVVAEVNPMQRAALTLRYVADLPVPEVARVLGRSVHATETEGEGGATLNTTDQFRSALERVVERTNAALAGDPIA